MRTSHRRVIPVCSTLLALALLGCALGVSPQSRSAGSSTNDGADASVDPSTCIPADAAATSDGMTSDVVSADATGLLPDGDTASCSGSCSHSICSSGSPLMESCSPCVQMIC